MKITLESTALLKAIRAVMAAIDKSSPVTILQNFLLRADGDTLSVTATNLDLTITDTVTAAVIQAGDVTANAEVLRRLVKEIPHDTWISLDDQVDGKIQLRAGSALLTLPTLPAAGFPKLAAGDSKTRFTLPASDLKYAFDRTAFAMSDEEIRYYLKGVFLHVIEIDGTALLRAVATDGHRLARVDIPAPEGALGMPGIIVRRDTVAAVQMLAGEGDVRVEASPTRIRLILDGGATVILAKPIDGQYPEYARVIPNGQGTTIRVERSPFLTALARASAILSKNRPAIKLVAEDGGLKLSVSDSDHGSTVEEIAAVISAPIEIGFDARYLSDILSACDGDAVVMTFTDHGSPVILQGSGDSSALYVLMPMRI